MKYLFIFILILIGGTYMTTYGFKNNKCKKEVYTKEDFAVLTGSVVTGIKSEDETLHYNTYFLDFPEGFNKDNCTCIAFGISTLLDTAQGYSYEILDPTESRSWLRSSLYRNILLGSNGQLSKISITIGTPYSEEQTIRYKIVLMRHSVSDSEYTLGDVNQDGSITSDDLDLINSYLLGTTALTAQQLKAADVNKDGVIDTADVNKLNQYILGNIDSLE